MTITRSVPASVNAVVAIGPGYTSSDVPSKPKRLASDWAGFSAVCHTLEEQHARRFGSLPVDPDELCKSRNDLPKKVLVVEYLPSDSSTLVFVCGSGKPSIWELPVPSTDIDALATALRNSMKECEDSMAAGVPLPRINDWREPAFLEIREPLVVLYAKLVAPIAGELEPYSMLMFALPK